MHFLAIGAVLFGVDVAMNPPEPPGDALAPIVISPEIEEALAKAWDERSGMPLSEAEQRAVTASWVRNEALYREARLLGLDRGDTIVRRRLVQKMEFLVEGGIEVVDPDDDALRAWFEDHAGDYVEPARTTFVHRFFSRSRRRDAAFAEAAQALARAPAAGRDATFDADPFAGPGSLTQVTSARISRDFGGDFATAVIEQEPGAWAGPIRSSFGFHLVFVLERSDAAEGHFEERRDEVLEDWRSQAQQVQRKQAIDAIVARHVAEAS